MARLKTRTTARYFENNKYVTDGLKCWTKSGTEFECRVECPYNKVKHEKDCIQAVCEDALSLIKELTEENEKLRYIIFNKKEQEKTVTKDLVEIRNGVKNLVKENERLRGILLQFTDIVHKWGNKNGYDTSEISLVPILNEATAIKSQIEADTVRKMQERLNNECFVNRGYEVFLEGTIDQIAKEMLEGSDESI